MQAQEARAQVCRTILIDNEIQLSLEHRNDQWARVRVGWPRDDGEIQLSLQEKNDTFHAVFGRDGMEA